MTDRIWFRAAACLVVAARIMAPNPEAAAQSYPPPGTTISPDRPLLLFGTPPIAPGGADPASDHMAVIWAELPDTLKPYAVLEVYVSGANASARCDTMRAVVSRLQTMRIPVALRLAESGEPALPLEPIQALLQEFPVIRGIEAAGLPFNEYIAYGGDPSLSWSAPTQWLMDAIDLAARHGRFITLHLDELHWLRIMANAQCRELYERIGQLHPYVIPLNRCRPHHNVARMGGLMGAWLEGAVDHWGIEVRSDWYAAARFIEPGVFGLPAAETPAPIYPVRAMMLNGFMTGAEVYAFPLTEDLWYRGDTERWTAGIQPTLERAIQRRHIATKAAVQEKIHLAYRLQYARNPEEFHLNLRDLDPVFDEGLMIHGLYGVERAGQIPELIPNTSRYYWIPILSPSAPNAVQDRFAEIVDAGRMASADAWRARAGIHYVAPEQGAAFVSAVGDTTYVMNTRENLYEEQPFRVRDIAAPVRTIHAERTEEGIALTWPLREGDVRYTVYRRMWPGGVPAPIASEIAVPQYVDTEPLEESAAYAVAALTNEREDYSGTVGLGEYLVFDRFTSPLVEEVRIGPGEQSAVSAPVGVSPAPADVARVWWPNTVGLSVAEAQAARAIADRIVQWDEAVRSERLDVVSDIYDEYYRDPAGWGQDYARRAFQWFFELSSACRMDRQIREWDFSQYETGVVRVRLYCRFEGVAMSDPSGRFADRPVWFPVHAGGETWLTWRLGERGWRLLATDPAVPNFREIMSFSSSPYSPLALGSDG